MDPLNLILLIIVIFIGLRLRSVLGRRDDDEQPGSRRDAYRLNRDAFDKKAQLGAQEAQRPIEPTARDDAPNNIAENKAENAGNLDVSETPDVNIDVNIDVNADAAADAEDAAPVQGRGLAFLRSVEPDFDEAGFLDGAGRAYEMILTAFADGDLEDVRGFLGDEVAAGFDGAIAARHTDGQQLVTRILRLDRPVLDDARIDADVISLDVRFRAELISFTCAQDAVIDEDALPAPATAHDVWTFARGRKAQDPNWVLVATQTA
jgi:predicted lipid-binding transport protein (Tim44 family)